MDLCPYLFCLSFYLLYFVLPPFKDNGLPFWVPDVLCQHSEIVLWNLLIVQMFFRWICGREIGLPILFLHHLRTTQEFAFVTRFQTDFFFFFWILKFVCISFKSWERILFDILVNAPFHELPNQLSIEIFLVPSFSPNLPRDIWSTDLTCEIILLASQNKVT